jgi:maltooligosyltrehalose trehalohydrolase
MRRNIGALYQPDTKKCEFVLWSPLTEKVDVEVVGAKGSARMEKDDRGYWTVTLPNIAPGTQYQYRLDGKNLRPDPASRMQPEGVHKASAVVSHQYKWKDKNWKGIALKDMIIYELHTGTFSQEGTFEGIIPHLKHLIELGVNVIEIMPVAQFPGNRNWGYDGVFPFAVQDSYGGPEGLKRLVEACHAKGIAVIMDVVYNHMGPEGNYLNDFGPYFTDRYGTPWGKALNFDDFYCDEVRNFFIENALCWFRDYHIDGLRLDAVHAIMDNGAKHFLKELAEETKALEQELGKELVLIAESDLNDARHTTPINKNGYGMDGQWADDMHHAIHALVTGEHQGYYEDYGKIEHLERAYVHGFTYTGQYSTFRKKSYGADVIHLPTKNFIVCIQNHDQIGNRMLGDRLTGQVSHEALKLAAAAYILSPYTPMLFMGEEYAEDRPFLYFVSHTDEGLIKAVRRGRKEEFKSFKWAGEPPDPQAESTFNESKLNWEFKDNPTQRKMFDYYKLLIKLRKEHPLLEDRQRKHMKTDINEEHCILFVTRKIKKRVLWMILNFSKQPVMVVPKMGGGKWNRILDSSDQVWNGPGSKSPIQLKKGKEIIVSAESVLIYQKEE